MKKEVCYTKTNKKRRVTGETGMKYADPYTPGAGFMPGHIAGRKETLERAEKYLNTIVLGYPQQSVIYYGLRGVGKTVLLNAIECKTDDMPILMGHIEIAEKRKIFVLESVDIPKALVEEAYRKGYTIVGVSAESVFISSGGCRNRPR